MDEVILQAKPKVADKTNRTLRNEGLVPAIFYGPGKDNVPIVINEKEMKQILRQHLENRLITLKIEGKDSADMTSIIKEVQKDVVEGNVIHVDFQYVSMDTKIKVDVPVDYVGESIGVKQGGVLQTILRTISIECFPNEIPEKFTVDISEMDVGTTMHVSDLSLPNVTLLTNPEEAMVTVNVPKEEPVEEEKPEGEEGEEAVVEEEGDEKGKEPEIVGAKGKKEEAEGKEKEAEKK